MQMCCHAECKSGAMASSVLADAAASASPKCRTAFLAYLFGKHGLPICIVTVPSRGGLNSLVRLKEALGCCDLLHACFG